VVACSADRSASTSEGSGADSGDEPDASTDTSTDAIDDVGSPEADAAADPDVGAPWRDMRESGPLAVGARTIRVEREGSGEAVLLPVEIWYPTAEPGEPSPPDAFFAEPEQRAAFVALLEQAPARCTNQSTGAVRDAAGDGGAHPVVAFSHCHGCTRFSSWTIAERLASHGFIVVAPDHVGDTLLEAQQGVSAPLNGAFLEVRATDIATALDAVLGADPSLLDAGIVADPTRVGVMGHSYGAATAGLVAQRDARVQAALALAAPMESPLLPGPTMADIKVPTGFFLAVEDNSITTLGNQFIRNNAAAATSRTWLWEVADAGHWSVSDLCGIVDDFAAGCGEGRRQVGRQPFTYLDNDSARSLAASFVLAFFEWSLRADRGAAGFMTRPPEAYRVETLELRQD
jgi:predicted dienelactone hydrolase